MLKEGIWNRELIYALATLGHTDEVIIADAGLPIPVEQDGQVVVDLALMAGIPGFLSVLDAVLAQTEVEFATAAEEVRENNPGVSAELEDRFEELNFVSHEDLKGRIAKAKVLVRTGEATPYANVILSAGVPF